jgi:uncharacterized protein (DUF2132 family)
MMGEGRTRTASGPFRAMETPMSSAHPNDPLHGLTLEAILLALVDRVGWPGMGRAVEIRCFNVDPSVKSSLAFLRRTPWARRKVEELYLSLPPEPGT